MMNLNLNKNRLKQARLTAKFTQKDVYKTTKFVKPQALSNYENGKSNPSNKVYITLSKLYHTSLDYLFKCDNYMNHSDYLTRHLGLTQDSIKILESKQIQSNILNNYLLSLKQKEGEKLWQ